MKGTLELSFSPLAAPKVASHTVQSEPSATVLSKVRPFRFSELQVSNKVVEKLGNSLFQRRISKYCELLKKEWWVKQQGPYWQSFQPQRVSYRLSSQWLDYFPMVRAMGNYLVQGEEGEKSQTTPFEEVVISASDASKIHMRSSILAAPLIVLSDLESFTPEDDWRKCEGYGSITKFHKNLALEIQVSTWTRERSSFGMHLRTASLLKPLFIRLCQKRVADDNSLFGSAIDVPGRMRDLQLGLDAFQVLGYEPVVLHGHTVVLAREPDEALVDMVSLSRRSLALGAGGVTLRYDSQVRPITQRNPDNFQSYRSYVDNLWNGRKGLSTAMYLPYLHQTIERDLFCENGLSYSKIRERFGINLEKIHPGLTSVLEDAGFVQLRDGAIHLTARGRKFGTKMARNFFLTERDMQYVN